MIIWCLGLVLFNISNGLVLILEYDLEQFIFQSLVCTRIYDSISRNPIDVGIYDGRWPSRARCTGSY